jgi:cyclopropane fatty-acyl-phospholipid synthase-like methyltransferase
MNFIGVVDITFSETYRERVRERVRERQIERRSQLNTEDTTNVLLGRASAQFIER